MALSMRTAPTSSFGTLLRDHRARRRWSQSSLAEQAEVSTRHLSFLETGKASPSREMVLVLSSALELPLRERNVLLGAAGFAPVYRESALDSPAMSDVRHAIGLLLSHHEPFPAMVFDPLWNVVKINQGAGALMSLVPMSDEAGPILGNGLRFLFHPKGARPFVENWDEVAAYVLDQVRRETHAAPRDGSAALLAEIEALAGPLRSVPPRTIESPLLEVRLRTGGRRLRFFTTITTLGTPLDVTVQELRIETYFPADPETRAIMESLRAS
ncbi:MAG: helix-turn-helix transcriptional regulator [Sandaracinus sp.]